MDQNTIDGLRTQVIAPRGHLIDGALVPASDSGVMDVLSPLDGQVLTCLLYTSPSPRDRG